MALFWLRSGVPLLQREFFRTYCYAFHHSSVWHGLHFFPWKAELVPVLSSSSSFFLVVVLHKLCLSELQVCFARLFVDDWMVATIYIGGDPLDGFLPVTLIGTLRHKLIDRDVRIEVCVSECPGVPNVCENQRVDNCFASLMHYISR